LRFNRESKAVDEDKPVIAALKRCATQNQAQHGLFPQAVKSCPSQHLLEPEFFHSLFRRAASRGPEDSER
jgi:hypothetical protein